VREKGTAEWIPSVVGVEEKERGRERANESLCEAGERTQILERVTSRLLDGFWLVLYSEKTRERG